MAYTWGEIKLESIKKMFLNNDIITKDDLSNMAEDNKYKIYLNAMPQAANEGIAECMKRSRPYIKTIEFTQRPIENLLGDNFKTRYYMCEEIVYETDGGKSYYFEMDAKGVATIYRMNLEGEWIEVAKHENKAQEPGVFTKYKGYVVNDLNQRVKIVFGGDSVYSFRNVAIYGLNYNQGGNKTKYIPDYKPYNIYDLRELAEDYYKIDKLYFENHNHELINRNDYIIQDGNTLIINKDLIGNFILKYQPYQKKITEETSDDVKLQLYDEIAVILPLYIASQLYKDDDIALATMYRNEFESALQDLYPRQDDTQYISKSGWL